jgi:2,3-bisphosphoglycerate-independent phosphoglycerate mutase
LGNLISKAIGRTGKPFDKGIEGTKNIGAFAIQGKQPEKLFTGRGIQR